MSKLLQLKSRLKGLSKFLSTIRLEKIKETLASGPGLEDFVVGEDKDQDVLSANLPPYLSPSIFTGNGKKVYYETYGCQMNVSDSQIVRSILRDAHYEETSNKNEADAILLLTCALREGAEKKIFDRVSALKRLKINRKGERKNVTIGILGCMAERLKERLIEETKSAVDLVAGPDSYRDLPRLLSATRTSGQPAVNVRLSLEETYADISPVTIDPLSPTAFVSIMRGCDNMCTYCIVPFTRGRERSRPIDSILDEIRMLSDNGIKQVTLLGQNVNSYRDLSESVHFGPAPKTDQKTVHGFKTVYKPKTDGRRFSELLDQVSLIDPNMRIRFTSPHPKDFPDEVLHLIKDRPNICKQLHLPAQSGNNETLERMGRGYTRESYLRLVDRIRDIVSDVCLTSDFIAGFCEETEQAHQDTLSLITEVGYTFCFSYPYSMREKTRAHRRFADNVPTDIKKRRTSEILEAFRESAGKHNKKLDGTEQLVLIEGDSKRSNTSWAGRTDGGIKVVIPKDQSDEITPGDYVAVKIESTTSQSLKGTIIRRTNIVDYFSRSTNPLLQLSL